MDPRYLARCIEGANGVSRCRGYQLTFAAPFSPPTHLKGLHMRQWFMLSMAAVALAGANAGHAGDLGINIILSGQVAPGVYGQVRLGNTAPQPLVYA
jgi:hypothetical protein